MGSQWLRFVHIGVVSGGMGGISNRYDVLNVAVMVSGCCIHEAMAVICAPIPQWGTVIVIALWLAGVCVNILWFIQKCYFWRSSRRGRVPRLQPHREHAGEYSTSDLAYPRELVNFQEGNREWDFMAKGLSENTLRRI